MRTILVLWFWLLASSAWAAPWDEPFGEPGAILAAAQAEAPADQGLAVLLDEVNYEVDEQRRVHQTWRLVYRVQTADSVDSAGSIQAWWTPWYQERPEVRVRVLHPDGSSDELDPSSLIEVRPGSGGSDVYSERLGLEGPLPRIEVGAVIERHITVRAHSPFFSAGEVHGYNLRWSDVPRARVVEIRASKGVPLLVKTVGFEGKSKRRKAKGQQIHRFELGPVASADAESMIPRDAQPGPEIRFTTGRSWADVASTYAARVDAQLAGIDLNELALEAAGGTTEPREQVARVFDWVRSRVRYTGLEFGENALVPVSPTTTLERGFGDCKDQSALLVGLLRALGQDAHIALLKASDWFDVDPELPGLRDFDHAIAYVDGLDLWLDPTDRSALAGELRPSTEDRLALIARPGTTELTRTARRSAADNTLRLERDFFLAPEGPSRLVVRQRASGAVGQEYRDGWSGTSDKDAREWLAGLTAEKWGSDQLGTLNYTAAAAEPFEVTYEVKDALRGLSLQDEAVVLVEPADLLSEVWSFFQPQEQAEPRSGPVAMSSPRRIEITTRVHPPPGFSVVDGPKSLDEQAGPGRWTRSSREEDGVFVLENSFELDGPRSFPAEELEPLRALVGRVQATPTLLISLEHESLALLRSGRFNEVLASARAAGAEHPDDPLPRLRQAEALLAAGMPLGARPLAEQVVQERPNWVRAWSTLGDARAAGFLGEDFGPGSDRDGSIAAWKRVVELDPEGFEHRVRLGSLLEHNALGALRGEGSDLKEAAAQVWKAVELGGGGRLPDAATIDLLVAGQDDEIRTILDSDRELTIRLRVALHAALDGAEAATAEAQRFAQSEEEKKKLLAGAFGVLFQLGELEAAAAIGGLAIGPQDGEEAYELIETMESAAEVDLHGLLQENSPGGAMYRVILFDPTRGSADVTELLGSSAIEAHGGPEAAMEAITAHGRKFAEQMAEVANAEAAVRVLAARDVFQIRPLADDLVALVVVHEDQASEPTFVVRERGRWKLLGEPGDEALHLEIRNRLARREVQAARELMTLLLPIRLPDLPLSLEQADARELKDLSLLFGCSGDAADCARRSGKAAERQGGYPRWELRRAELLWWLRAGQGQRAEAVAQELVDAAPTSRALELLWLTQQEQGKRDEAAATLQVLLKTNPAAALQVRIRQASSFRDRDELERLEDAARKSSNPAYSLNNLAWGYLLAGMMEHSLSAAEEAVAKGKRQSTAALHTLAAAYAESDRLEDARRTLIELRGKQHNWQPREEDWYVIGRIAAGYGLTEQARTAYERVQKPEQGVSQSTWQLTQAALARLD